MTKPTRQQPNKSVGESEISEESYLRFQIRNQKRRNKNDSAIQNLGVKVTIVAPEEYEKYKSEQPEKATQEEIERIKMILEVRSIGSLFTSNYKLNK